jgi:hypothetical protein
VETPRFIARERECSPIDHGGVPAGTVHKVTRLLPRRPEALPPPISC